jgi:hypothetical protein
MERNQPRLSSAPGLVGEFATACGSGIQWTKISVPPWPALLVSVLSLIWPALLNGYPIVFADTGTYLSQAMHGYLGWDRPVF